MMIKLSESTILIGTTIITSVAALFTLIGLATPKWLKSEGLGLWNCHRVCSTSTATLTILALLFLVAAVIFLVILILRSLPRSFRILPVILLFMATLFLLISPAIYLRRFHKVGYSYELIVTAHAFAFIGSVVLAFWLGTTVDEGGPSITTSPTRSPVTIAMPSMRSS